MQCRRRHITKVGEKGSASGVLFTVDLTANHQLLRYLLTVGAPPIVIVGSGFAGLVAATALRASGADVVLVDKASRPGGRLSTRTVNGHAFDSGVRSFDVHDREVLRNLLDLAGDRLQVNDLATGWRLAWEGSAGDLARAMAVDLRIENAMVTHLDTSDSVGVGLWGSTETLAVSDVLLTIPVPQARLLLRRSGIREPASLAGVEYERRLILLAVVDDHPGVAVADSDVFDDVALTAQGEYPWLLRAQVTAEGSRRRWDQDATHALAELLLEASSILGGATILKADCMRWRYAGATNVSTAASFAGVDGLPILIGGDGFGSDPCPGASVARACRLGLDMALQAMSR